ncbi:hypothetical protein [Hyphomonas sp. KY3]|uniref:hypothetical protein n=1 Tax=Hyphomonas sp. KY3 TaxID=2016196 RepID=UPI001A8C2224|nr:hypothetical protein [Hyphomonas sp. KY3]
MKLWTYPNLFKEPGKELIDLMIIFRNNVLLFSDKSCTYPRSEDECLNWNRWYKRAISKSAQQAAQARRWITERPDQVFLDAKATERVPVSLPSRENMNVHLICVATGASARCQEATGQPYLGINLTATDAEIPLQIGTVSRAHGHLHVLDENSLRLLTSELDTIRDFVNYLDAKRDLYAGGKFKAAGSEADLLAYYLWNDRTFVEGNDEFELERGLWARVEANAAFLAGRALNLQHRIWDTLLEVAIDAYLDEALEYGNEVEMEDYELLVRTMASESRFRRRILSENILERAARARNERVASLLPSEQDGVLYVLLIGQGAPTNQYNAYRVERLQELQLRCHAAKAAYPEFTVIIGFGLDALGVEGSSEDFIYMDTSLWTEENLALAQRIGAEAGYFQADNVQVQNNHADEYPEIE